VELPDGGVAGSAHLDVHRRVLRSDTSRGLTPGEVEHRVAPRPEVGALRAASKRPLEPVTVAVDKAGDLDSVGHLRENTHVLRRLLVVGLAWACLCVPAAAHAGTVAIFYYPWYGTPAHDGAWQHWNQNRHRPPNDLYSRFYPARGPYSSDDPAVVDQQMAEIAAAGIDEVVSSWWGRGSAEDARLQLVLAAARRHHVQPAIHLEPYAGRSPASILLDLKYLAALGVRDVYVYHPRDFGSADWAAMRPQVPASLRLFAGTELVGFAAAGLFDGFYTYDFINYSGGKFIRLCNQAHAVHLLSRADCRSRLRRGPRRRVARAQCATQRRDLRQPLDGSPGGEAGHGDDHELQRVGGGHADRGRGAAPRLPRL